MERQLYIDRCGEQIFPPPFTATARDYYGFVIRADQKVIQAHICERYFNSPLRHAGRFIAFPHVIFIFSNVENARSAAENYSELGSFSYREAAVWTLIGDREAQQLRWFQPYMFVDESVAMVTGREIYGFPKTLGSFRIPNGPTAPDRLWVKTSVVQDRGAQGSQQLLFEAGRRPDSTAACSGCNEDDFMAQLLHMLKVNPKYFEQFEIPAEMATQFYKDLSAMQLPLMFLKEFRSAVNPTHADGMLIQEAKCQITRFRNAGLYNGTYELAINDVISHPIRNDLGLAKGQLQVEAAFYLSFDFELGTCAILS
ncbi:MAG: acetoacetate decarboxylase family protein [Nitrospiraceae bacterium]